VWTTRAKKFLTPGWELVGRTLGVRQDRAMIGAPTVVFLPGAAGSAQFWEPVASRLPADWDRALLDWPGAGDQPHDAGVESFEGLIELSARRVSGQSDLVAQSMGGVVAVGIALRHPEKVRRLVLVATSGGIGVTALGAGDWRADYRAQFPNAAAWVTERSDDYTSQLPGLIAPTLLLWGDRDPISPVAVGRRLTELLPNSRLAVISGGTHAMAVEQPAAVAEAVIAHLS
jgi:pimeloyl-ACP methyl ester carboxylesterase